MSSVPTEYRCGIDGTGDDRDILLQSDREPTAWQRVWRVGIAPQLTTKDIEGLKTALERNDGRLITGATTYPPPLQCMENEPVESCCVLCYALLDGMQPSAVSVGPLEQRFSEVCWERDQRLGEPGSIRWFLDFVDETPRAELRRQLIPEIERALAQRQPATVGGAA